MNNCFKKDIFSNNKILWNKKNLIKENIFQEIKIFFKKNNFGLLSNVQKRLGVEINSKNFKIKVHNKIYFLKKWSNNSTSKEINLILNLNERLINKRPLVPKIIKINKKNKFKIGNNYWTIYFFINANHYSGYGLQLSNTSFQIGKFFQILNYLSKQNKSLKGPQYYNAKNQQILNKMKKNRKKWNLIFGAKLAKKLNQNWDLIENIYSSNFKKKKIAKVNQISHLDLHPHNILNKKEMFNSFLDLESCKKMNAGYALAFCCLKICKQTIIKKKLKKDNEKKLLVEIFIKQIEKNYPQIKKLYKDFYYFATSEVIRRMMIIFQLNLEKKLKTWNKVLPIQIDHLKESKVLFKN